MARFMHHGPIIARARVRACKGVLQTRMLIPSRSPELSRRDAAVSPSPLFCFPRIPDGCPDVSFTVFVVVVIVHGNDFAISPLNAPGITEVPATRIVAQDQLFTPRPTLVAAQPGSHAIGLRAVTVGDCQAAVLQFDQRRRIALRTACFRLPSQTMMGINCVSQYELFKEL